MNSVPALIDQHGNALRPSARVTAHDAANTWSRNLASWNPSLLSADAAILPERDTIAARVHDLVRNDGWASSALQKHLDNVIGGGLRLSARPNWRALGQTREWAIEWAREVEAAWFLYAEDPMNYCDAARQSSMNGIFGRLYRHRILDGELLCVMLWLPGRGNYATTVQVVDPGRLSNPNGKPDTETLRGGVEMDEFGAATGYHFRRRHPGDVFLSVGRASNFAWDRVDRETPFGRQIVIHDFDQERAGQTRGRSPLAPVVEKLKQLSQYDKSELGAAILNAVFAAFITSPYDAEMVQSGLDSEALSEYQRQRVEYHTNPDDLHLNRGVRIPHLFPGESFEFPQAARPNTAYASFLEASLRNVAAAAGVSYEQLTMDWSKTNYSSARAAMVEVWKFFTARGATFKRQTASQIFCAWLEEAIDRGDVRLPPGAPPFDVAKAAYTRARWIGPGRGWVDPLKEVNAAKERMASNMSTLQDEAAEQGGDWEEVLEQRAVEKARMKELGLTPPAPAPAAAPPAAPEPGEPPDDVTGQEPETEGEEAPDARPGAP